VPTVTDALILAVSDPVLVKANEEIDETKVKLDRKAATEDPDIAGIVPGPQPLPYDLLDEEEKV